MERFQKLHNRRLRAIIALMTAIALFFTVLLYLATIVNGLSDGESTELNTVVTTATENAARGNITDRYGEVLVTALASDPTVCLVEFSFTVAHGLNRIYLTAHITV